MSFREAVFADYEANFEKKASWAKIPLGYFTKVGFRAMLLYRLARGARTRGIPAIGPILDRWIKRSCQIDICSLAEIGPGLAIPHPVGIVVGSKSTIGRNCLLLQCVTLGGAGGKRRADGGSQPLVGDNVIMGAGAKLVGPVVIGNRVTIGANAVVTHDMPDDCIAVGIPARPLKKRSGSEA